MGTRKCPGGPEELPGVTRSYPELPGLYPESGETPGNSKLV